MIRNAIKKLFDFLFAKEESLLLEQRILVAALIMGFCLCLLGIISNLFLTTSFIAILLPVILFGVILFLYILVRFKKKFSPIGVITAISGILGISLIWIYNGGINGSNIMPAFVILILGLIIVSDKTKIYVLAFFVVINILLLLIQLYRPDLIIGFTDEKSRWIDNLITLIFSALVVFFTIRFLHRSYITERLRAEESDENFRSIFEYNSSAMAIFEPNSTISKVNEEFCKLSGYTKQEAIGMSREQFIPVEEIERLKNFSNSRLRNPVDAPAKYEFKFITKNGELGYAIASVATLNNQKRIASFVDITEWKKSEILIGERNEELKRINIDKDKFLSIVAHDLRSPFNSFLGLTNLLSEEIDTLKMQDIKKLVGMINKSANNLYRLLDNLLYWARMKQGLVPFEPKHFNFINICQDTIEVFKSNAEIKGIVISLISSEDLICYADIDMLRAILRNLISNAIKFTQKNGTIKINAEVVSGNVLISVADSGIGINSENIKKLFDISQVLTTKGTDNETGTGLGLFLCKEFVEKHGGIIWVESESGKGSTFSFKLPLLP